jgi:hypothetical protein
MIQKTGVRSQNDTEYRRQESGDRMQNHTGVRIQNSGEKTGTRCQVSGN